jgi:histone H3/H4
MLLIMLLIMCIFHQAGAYSCAMASVYSIEVLKIVVAQICQTIGWHAIQSTPLNIMVDILHKYIIELGKNAHSYAEHCEYSYS